MNRAQLIGRLGRDPEIRYTQGGSAVCSFSVATSERWKDKQSGESKEQTEWHNIVAFGRQGEVCGEYLRKGSQVYLEGRIQTDSYEKDGIKRYTTKIVLQRFEFLDSKKDDNQPRTQSKPAQKPTNEALPEMEEDDIPF